MNITETLLSNCELLTVSVISHYPSVTQKYFLKFETKFDDIYMYIWYSECELGQSPNIYDQATQKKLKSNIFSESVSA